MGVNKKYSAVDLTDLAVGILILGVVVVIGSQLLTNYRDNQLTGLDTVTTINETGVKMNSSYGKYTLSHTWGQSVVACYCNMTGTGAVISSCVENQTIPSTNYTVTIDSVGGGMSLVNSTVTAYTDSACTYKWYNTSRVDWDLPNKALLGVAEYGNWFDIIVIVGVAGLILALLFMAFGNRGQESGVQY